MSVKSFPVSESFSSRIERSMACYSAYITLVLADPSEDRAMPQRFCAARKSLSRLTAASFNRAISSWFSVGASSWIFPWREYFLRISCLISFVMPDLSHSSQRSVRSQGNSRSLIYVLGLSPKILRVSSSNWGSVTFLPSAVIPWGKFSLSSSGGSTYSV